MASVLIVEDDEQVRASLRAMLERAGHAVREAADGVAAVEAVADEPPDVVLLDLIMPEKEGLETLREMKDMHAETPVIAMSGGGRIGPQGYLKMAVRLGAAAALSKPLARVDLLAALAGVLSGEAQSAGE